MARRKAQEQRDDLCSHCKGYGWEPKTWNHCTVCHGFGIIYPAPDERTKEWMREPAASVSHRTSRARKDGRRAGTAEWYTPRWLLDRVTAFYGAPPFDPCPPSGGVVAENGLLVPWRGQVFVNPPYGKPVAAWVRRAMTEPVRELLLLVPAYTETRWFAPLYQHTLCMLAGRLRFEYGGKAREAAPYPSVLCYRGRRYRAFAEAFCDLGPVVRTYHARQEVRQPTLLEVSA